MTMENVIGVYALTRVELITSTDVEINGIAVFLAKVSQSNGHGSLNLTLECSRRVITHGKFNTKENRYLVQTSSTV